jgi:hypothetical protein
MAATQRVKVQEDPTPEDATRVGTLNQVMGGADQVVVDGVQDPRVEGTALKTPPRQRMVEIRTEDIEEMSYISGGVRAGSPSRLETGTGAAGSRTELETLGKVWH